MSRPAGSDAGRILDRLRRREVSAAEVVRGCLERIEALDPKINAVLRVNPRAEAEALEIDRRIAAGSFGPLSGLPVAIKDNIATRDLETTCASNVLRGFRPARDATVVSRLREAGAVILCKTNMDEFAMGSSTENSAFGPTRNPWDPDRVPGGSSGGSAAAVASGMAPLALGSDTGGSVRQPAAFCGVVGMKPTYGRVSRSGLVAFASSLDQIGPLAETVEDCARLLQVLAGRDACDATSSPAPVDDYLEFTRRGVSGIRIGLPREYLGTGLDPEIAAAVRLAAARLEEHGARVEEVSLPHTPYAVPAYYVVAPAEASSNLARYDGVRYGLREDPGAGLEAMYRATRRAGFGAEVKRRIMLGTYALSAGYYEAFYGKAARVRTLLRRDFLDVFAAGVDLILCPTTPTCAFRIGEKADDPLAMYLSDVYTVTMNLAGVPAMSVPAGLASSALPIGVQIVGPEFAEGRILQAAAVIEATLGRLQSPPLGRLPAPPRPGEP